MTDKLAKEKLGLKFLFMDESYCKQTRISVLTGLVVPTEAYSDIRSDFYSVVTKIVGELESKKAFIHQLPELHANSLLANYPQASEEIHFQLYRELVGIVISYQLQIYRSGIVLDKSLRKQEGMDGFFHDDPLLLGICWSRLLIMLQNEMAKNLIIPVMDGFDPKMVKKFSEAVISTHSLRSHPTLGSGAIKNTQNILGEVFYADSKYGIITQLADLIGYLFLTNDLVKHGKTLGSYKAGLYPIAQTIPSELLVESIDDWMQN